MRIVIDTNIWLAGLLWRGVSWQLLRYAEQGKLNICTAYPAMLELEEVLGYAQFQSRLALLNLQPSQVVTFALSIATVFDINRVHPPIVYEDPDDDVLLLCGIAAQARYIVTQDKHLLKLKKYSGISILTIEDFFISEAVFIGNLRMK